MSTAYVGLGSNLGDRHRMLMQAIEALDWGDVRVTSRSRIYQTDPVGGPEGQPDFLNQVIGVETVLEPRALWERCSAVEAALGRSRTHEPRWGPRTIDLDLLLFEELVLDDGDLVLPHPRLHERAFVLVPLAEVAPDAVVPGRGTARELADAIGSSGVRPL